MNKWTTIYFHSVTFLCPAYNENNLKNKQVKVNKGGELKEQNTYKLA